MELWPGSRLAIIKPSVLLFLRPEPSFEVNETLYSLCINMPVPTESPPPTTETPQALLKEHIAEAAGKAHHLLLVRKVTLRGVLRGLAHKRAFYR